METETDNITALQIAREATTPTQLVALAIANNISHESLAKLMDLQERWEANTARKEYVQAMSDFKKEAPPAILKHSKVDFTSGKGRTSYNYANLGDVVQQITPLLAKHGLHAAWETATPKDGPITITCHVTHSAGHRESVALSGPADTSGNKNAIQAIGSCVTYLQRYTLLAALGLATMEDDDGRGGPEGGNDKQEPQTQQDPWQLALQNRKTIPALKALLEHAEKEAMPVDYIQAVKDKIASLTPASKGGQSRSEPANPTADQDGNNTPSTSAPKQTSTQTDTSHGNTANSKTAELATKLNEQFPGSKSGTVSTGNPPGSTPTAPASGKTITPSGRTANALNWAKTATMEGIAKAQKNMKREEFGEDNYRAIMAAFAARERELSAPHAGPGDDPLTNLGLLLRDKTTAGDFDDMAKHWQEDSHSVDQATYDKGVQAIQQARISKGV
jgi:hypothetical protein